MLADTPPKIILSLGLALLTQVAPSVIAQQQYANLGNLTLVSGDTIKACRIGYRIAGALNEQRTNVIVMPTWFTGSTQDLEDFGVIGPGKLADTNRFFVISIDALGNGESCSPSNSSEQPGAAFPRISTTDMVASQYRLLTEHLDIHHVRAVMGISMGGMQTLRWISQYPAFMDKAVSIDGSPKMTAYDLLQWKLHQKIIKTLQEDGRSDEDIAAILGPLNRLTLTTPEKVAMEVPPERIDDLFAESTRGYSGYDWNDYVAQLHAMIDHDLLGDDPAALVRAVQADVLITGVPEDHMVSPIQARKLAKALNAEYFSLESNCGHLGTSCEAARIAARVARFLDN